MCLGDTFFIPADEKTAKITGDGVLLITEIRKYTAQIENGAVYIKDDLGFIVAESPIGDDAEAALDALLKSKNMCRADLSF